MGGYQLVNEVFHMVLSITDCGCDIDTRRAFAPSQSRLRVPSIRHISLPRKARVSQSGLARTGGSRRTLMVRWFSLSAGGCANISLIDDPLPPARGSGVISPNRIDVVGGRGSSSVGGRGSPSIGSPEKATGKIDPGVDRLLQLSFAP